MLKLLILLGIGNVWFVVNGKICDWGLVIYLITKTRCELPVRTKPQIPKTTMLA
ncbi:MAG: hypothetical protein LBI18_06570 [Planctomycetaceae bacterium]|nr:hypothetical protein [Planctomycetaceae bacterium]